MKDKIEKYHRKASYYRTRKVAIFAMAIMFLTASVAVPLSLLSVEATPTSSSSEVTNSDIDSQID